MTAMTPIPARFSLSSAKVLLLGSSHTGSASVAPRVTFARPIDRCLEKPLFAKNFKGFNSGRRFVESAPEFMRRRINVVHHPDGGSSAESVFHCSGDGYKGAFSTYTREVRKEPLISFEQEIELGRLVSLGGPEGLKAQQKLVVANLRLVLANVRRYSPKRAIDEDLVQAGNMGLMKAARKFDYSRGIKFSTYASWWIRQSIVRSIQQEKRFIRVPVFKMEIMYKVKKHFEGLAQLKGRDPTPEELAEHVEMSVDEVMTILIRLYSVRSLDEPVGDEVTSGRLMDFIPDEKPREPTENYDSHQLRLQIDEVLATLTPREEKIVRMHNGIDEPKSYSFEEIATRMGISRQRVSQVYGRTLKKLRSMKRRDLLAAFEFFGLG